MNNPHDSSESWGSIVVRYPQSLEDNGKIANVSNDTLGC